MLGTELLLSLGLCLRNSQMGSPGEEAGMCEWEVAEGLSDKD